MTDLANLKVMSWNLWWQFGPWRERAAAIAATLERENADIICLQEVWGDGRRNFAAELADRLGYRHVYAPGAKPNGVFMGNAVLSRWPIAGHETIGLYDQKGDEELRVALRADIDAPVGRIPVFCTHLNYKPDHSHIRQKQVAGLMNFVNASRPWKFPPILCGDFNADPASDEIRMITGLTSVPVPGLTLRDTWEFCHPGELGLTWSSENPFAAETLEQDRRIDYVFSGTPAPNGAGHVLDCRIAGNAPVDGVWPSDHFAVVATLRL